MNNTQKKIDYMRDGNNAVIIDSISSESPILVMNAIIEGVRYSVQDERFVEKLKSASNNHVELLGIKISEVAKAAMDLLHIRKYNGTDKKVIELINSRFNF